MWTPRRVMIFCVCFVVFFLVYLGYAWTYIGRMDGLPPLPAAYWPDPQEGVEFRPTTDRPPSSLERKLKLAFGEDCKERKWAIRLELHSRNMVLASQHFRVENGRVALVPLSLAVFGKNKTADQQPELNTIRASVAYLTFDRPVTNFSEIPSRKVVEAELGGKIEVVNNRRRAERDQDLRLNIPTGPLYYREENHRMWTEGWVELVDFKSKPHPHSIKGKGMEMELLTEIPQVRPGERPNPNARANITGVKWVVLNSAVDMNLYTDNQGGLMGNTTPLSKTDDKKVVNAKPAPPTASTRSHLRITTPGKFRYEIHKDHDMATFDIVPAGPIRPSHLPTHVVVQRRNQATGASEQVICHHLALRLKRKDADKKNPQPGKPVANRPTAKADVPGGPMESVEIETVHATVNRVAGQIKEVILTSDSEKIVAQGTSFFHDVPKQLTILKGSPVTVDKENGIQRIVAREIRLVSVKPTPEAAKKDPRTHQHVTALGPGIISLIDTKQKKTIRASWQNLLTSVREGNEDILTLTGSSRFLDEQAGQSLRADVLKVWLEEVDKKQAVPASGTTSESRRPKHLEATGHVVARSKDMNIHDTSRLVVWFKDVPDATHLPPGTVVQQGKPQQPVVAGPDKRSPGTLAPGSNPGNTATPELINPSFPRPLPNGPQQPGHLAGKPMSRPMDTGPILAPANAGQQSKPFDLKARSVEAWVLRSSIKSSIDQLWCEGGVEIKQDPAKAEEKGTKIDGETLKMTAGQDGNYFLVVTGDVAQLQTDKIYILGPEVNIDQGSNKAWVIGEGAMQMESENNFQGEKLAKPVPLTVHWNKSMLFNGESAEFHGNIQAVQEKARLACQRLQVYFDRPISLKQGNKKDEPAKVRNLVCDREVRIEELVGTQDSVQKYTRLEGPAVQMIALESEELPGNKNPRKENPGNVVYASGPGSISVYEPGSSDDPVFGIDSPNTSRKAAPKPATGTPAAKEMKITYVFFQKRMDANSKTNTAKFYEGVRVLHMPAGSRKHDTVVDLDMILANELPEGSLYIRCDLLKVLDHPTDGKPNKQMEAIGKVYVQGREFYARADRLYFNQQKQQIILDGRSSGNATLKRYRRVGDRPEEVEGKQIIYNRSTGKINVIGASSISGQTVPGKK